MLQWTNIYIHMAQLNLNMHTNSSHRYVLLQMNDVFQAHLREIDMQLDFRKLTKQSQKVHFTIIDNLTYATQCCFQTYITNLSAFIMETPSPYTGHQMRGMGQKFTSMPLRYLLGPLGLYFMLVGHVATPNNVFMVIFSTLTLLTPTQLPSHPPPSYAGLKVVPT